MILLEISTNELILIYSISFILTFVLLGITIATAIRVNKRDRQNLVIIELLATIAEKNGADMELVKKLIERAEL